jgi:hypothetical protein
LLVGIHACLAASLVAMAVPQLEEVASQLAPGRQGPSRLLFVGLVFSTFALAAVIGAAIVAWTRGRSDWLILADAVASVAAWSVLLIYMFFDPRPVFLAMGLAPIGLCVAVADAVGSRRRRLATDGHQDSS